MSADSPLGIRFITLCLDLPNISRAPENLWWFEWHRQRKMIFDKHFQLQLTLAKKDFKLI